MASTTWVKAMARDALAEKGRAVVRAAGKQIALFDTPDGVFACNNRCPHEGYPLREGSLDGGCTLTCNWHNWKFDLRTGANLYGGDRLRVYPVAVRDGAVWVDVAEPPFAERRAEIMTALRDAFDDNDYERMARELARLRVLGADPVEAVAAAIEWSYDRLEFGWTHAYAGAADWLALHDARGGGDAAGLVCLMEIVGHIADDVLRQPTFPYAEEERPYDEDAFVDAVEGEDEAAAVAMVRGGLAAGLGVAGLERGLSRAALAHYNDFGHALIYVAKARELIERIGGDVAEPLLAALARGLVYATREDHIPEFRDYPRALAAWGEGGNGRAPAAADFRGLNARQAMKRAAAHGAAPAEDLYRALLGANAANMLAYDLRFQERTEGPLQDNVGWLSFTHGLTFANAVRRQCTRFPELWPAGLLQMACFAGRNAAYTDEAVDIEAWRVADPGAFLDGAIDGLFDHGREEFIVSVHLIKTLTAAREEVRSGAAGEHAATVAAAINRFLHSPLKRKHALRTARQAMEFVALDG